MKPQVNAALLDWTEPLTLKTVTRTSVNFIETETTTTTTIQAVVQPASPQAIRAEQLDWSLRHLTLHSESAMAVGQFVSFEGGDYKIVSVRDYSAYGYFEATAEQTRRAAHGA
jgi:hypothetical protein